MHKYYHYGQLERRRHRRRKWISRALLSSGYKADFTVESLREVDRFFDEHIEDGIAKPDGLLGADLGKRIFSVGAYMGEVIRLSRCGEWIADDIDPKGEINVELRLPDGTRCWPVQRAMKRMKMGSEDSITAWGLSLGLNLGR